MRTVLGEQRNVKQGSEDHSVFQTTVYMLQLNVERKCAFKTFFKKMTLHTPGFSIRIFENNLAKTRKLFNTSEGRC